MPPLIAVAHGSKDPRAAATVGDLLALVRSRAPGVDVRAAFLDHAAPSLRQALSAVAVTSGGDGGDGACVVVPLLLTAAYHSKTDIPAQVAAAAPVLPRLDVRYANTLGPHPLLLAALERRLSQAGAGASDRSSTSVVLAAAGSSDPAANATIAALAARWQRDGGWRRVLPAFASAASPAPAQAVAALRASGGPVVVATYLLAPGYFADKIRADALAAGADAVCDALGAAPEVAEVIVNRYARAASAPPRAAARVASSAQLS